MSSSVNAPAADAVRATEESAPYCVPRAAVGHMPFAGHRTQREVREEGDRKQILRGLGR
jgi:hypothetical protein